MAARCPAVTGSVPPASLKSSLPTSSSRRWFSQVPSRPKAKATPLVPSSRRVTCLRWGMRWKIDRKKMVAAATVSTKTISPQEPLL